MTCKTCKQEKPASEFFRHKNTKTGYRLSRCKKCASLYQMARRRDNKRKLVEYKGGKCEVCGYSKCMDALDFHHEEDKEFQIARGKQYAFERAKREVEKCKLLCNRCHKELHAGMIDLN